MKYRIKLSSSSLLSLISTHPPVPGARASRFAALFPKGTVRDLSTLSSVDDSLSFISEDPGDAVNTGDFPPGGLLLLAKKNDQAYIIDRVEPSARVVSDLIFALPNERRLSLLADICPDVPVSVALLLSAEHLKSDQDGLFFSVETAETETDIKF